MRFTKPNYRSCEELTLLCNEIDEMQKKFVCLFSQIADAKEFSENLLFNAPVMSEFLDGIIEYDNVEQLEELAKLSCQIKFNRIKKNIKLRIKKVMETLEAGGERNDDGSRELKRIFQGILLNDGESFFQ